MTVKPPTSRARLDAFRDNWSTLGLYERFEQVVALAIAGIVAIRPGAGGRAPDGADERA